MTSLRSLITSIPVLGYSLKVLHGIVNLPKVREDLLAEIRRLEARTVDREELSRDVIAIEQHLSNQIRAVEERTVDRDDFMRSVAALERQLREGQQALDTYLAEREETNRRIARTEAGASDAAIALAIINDRLGTIQAQLSETVLAIHELRALEQHLATLSASARKAQRDQSSLAREAGCTSERLTATEVKVADILRALQSKTQVNSVRPSVEFEDNQASTQVSTALNAAK